jgi:hypothetical protein
MNDTPLPGPLDEFLHQLPAGPDRTQRQRELLQETTSHLPPLRRMHRVKRLSVLAVTTVTLALICSFVYLMHLGLQWAENIRDLPHVQQHKQPVPEKPQAQPIAPPDEKAPAPAVDKSAPLAVALEWKAFDAPGAKRSELYLKAGDRYIEDQRDLASAVRCYSQAVQMAHAKDLEIDPDDNWLVMVLKLDRIERQKEK